MLFSFTGFMPWDFSVPCSVILFELFFLSFSPAERSTDSERIILWVSHEIEEMDIIDAKSCNSVADDVSLVIEWSWLTAWTPGCLFRGLHTVFTKLWGYSTPLGIETFRSGEGLGGRARSTHAGADECWTPVRCWVSGIWLHAAFLNCIKLNANENDICLPKQCFAATFHAHTYTKWAEAWALNHKKQCYAVH